MAKAHYSNEFMTTVSRLQNLQIYLQNQSAATIAELACHFNVSDETIRRDLKRLAEKGVVEKFHGGVRLSSLIVEPPFNRRLNQAATQKALIAEHAAHVIGDSATVVLDNSTTCCYLAKQLVHRNDLTILTISLEIARIFSTAQNPHRIILPSGELRPDNQTLTGIHTLEFMSKFVPDFFVFSVAACSVQGGLDFDIFEAEFKRAMIPRTRKTMLLADASKFGKPGLMHVCDWHEIDFLITDLPPSPDIELPNTSVLVVASSDSPLSR